MLSCGSQFSIFNVLLLQQFISMPSGEYGIHTILIFGIGKLYTLEQ